MNTNHLKLIAIIAMTIDHVCDLIYPSFAAKPGAIGLHIVGRLTAPIMWFFVCEGYHYTHNVKKYMLRMGVFAIISHFAYCFAFGINPIPFSTGIFNQTSVMYPLFVAVLVMWMQDHDLPMKNWVKSIMIFGLVWSAFPADWSCIAVSFFFVSKVYALVQIGVLLVYPVLRLDNGEKGKAKWMKYGDVSLLF